ncbi:hypothetical protein DUI87_09529 [Hirundo rustica rustica]|uniref:Uncharacterized protein n=1 Tax=Hirundo rustica rustica TaxID=333673 RepID=A0A3M0KN09_HIRRU|nr:hypothetical protein DUI87_09529 [Hirundo rustica rustica]
MLSDSYEVPKKVLLRSWQKKLLVTSSADRNLCSCIGFELIDSEQTLLIQISLAPQQHAIVALTPMLDMKKKAVQTGSGTLPAAQDEDLAYSLKVSELQGKRTSAMDLLICNSNCNYIKHFALTVSSFDSTAAPDKRPLICTPVAEKKW